MRLLRVVKRMEREKEEGEWVEEEVCKSFGDDVLGK